MPNGNSEHLAGGNGHSTAAETIYALSDEQILDIAEDANVDDVSIDADEGAALAANEASRDGADPAQGIGTAQAVTSSPGVAQTSVTGTGAGQSPSTQAPPEWLAQAMADPQRGGEARQFWESTQSAQRDSAAYRATFPTPDAARDAASRAEQLTSLDRAYFGAAGVPPQQLSASREALAQQLLRDDPAAFRDMLAAGLRAVGVTNVAGVIPPQAGARPNADTAERPDATSHGSLVSQNTQNPAAASRLEDADSARSEALRQYAAFERVTNEELDRTLRPEIARILERALPASRANDTGRATQARLAGMVYGEIETALKQDRALSEQVAQLLRGGASPGQRGTSGLRFDDGTRAQVVRLVAARAAALAPSAARRVLGEWTQSAMSAHRERSSRSDAARSRVNLAPASSPSPSMARDAIRDATRDATSASRPEQRSASSSSARNDTRDRASRRGIDYRALSDEDILNL